MKVFQAGKPVTLSASQLVAAGGQGTVYASGGWCYKIYHDPANSLPAKKLTELSVLDRPEIIRPESMLTDKDGVAVGYTMRQVKNPQHIPPLFTRAFRERSGIDPGQVFALVLKLRDVVAYTHSKRILIVDLNELNWLASRKLDEVWAIDVDSWQTPSYPAPVIMDTVRDRHAKKKNKAWQWDEGTDWFSFAVIATQLLVGIHPYKGRHPDCHPADQAERLEARMNGNLSVFNPKTVLPPPCFPVADVPPAYRQWLEAVLEHGERTPAPATGDLARRPAPAVPQAAVVAGSEVVKFHEVVRVPGASPIISIGSTPAAVVCVLTRDGRVYYKTISSGGSDSVTLVANLRSPENASVAISPVGVPFIVWHDEKTDEAVSVQLGEGEFDRQPGRPVVTVDGRVYVQRGEIVTEQTFARTKGVWLAGSRVAANILEGSSTLYCGVVVQQLLDAWYATVFPSPGHSYQVRLAGGGKVVDARYDGGVLVTISVDPKSGLYTRRTYSFDASHTKHWLQEAVGVDYAGIAFVRLPKGVVVSITEDERVEAFVASHKPSPVSQWATRRLSPADEIARQGDNVLVADGTCVLRVSLK